MSAFIIIHGHPDYKIDPLGRVESRKSGLVLKHDKHGRVLIRQRVGRPRYFYVGELLVLAGLIAGEGAKKRPADADASLKTALHTTQDTRAEAKGARESLAKARRINGHLIALVAKLRGRVAELESAGGGGSLSTAGDAGSETWRQA